MYNHPKPKFFIFFFLCLHFFFNVSFAGEDKSPTTSSTGKNPFTVKDSLIRYWNHKISNNLPKPSFLISKASPLTVVDAAFLVKLADQNALSTHLPFFCSSANLACFTDVSLSLEKHIREDSFRNYKQKLTGDGEDSFRNYRQKITGDGEDSFRNYRQKLTEEDSFRNYRQKLTGDGEDSFRNYRQKLTGEDSFRNYRQKFTGDGEDSFRNYRQKLTGDGEDSFRNYGQKLTEEDSFRNYGQKLTEEDSFRNYRQKLTGDGEESFRNYRQKLTGEVSFRNYRQKLTGEDSFRNYRQELTGDGEDSFRNYRQKLTGDVDGKPVNIWVEPGMFFRESNMKQGTIMPMPDFRDKMPKRSFLPRSLSSKLPFSTSNLSQLKQIFHASDNSSIENILKNTIELCERGPSPGETQRCVGSIEDMIDFVVSVLGRNVVVRSMEGVKGSKKDVMVGVVKGINGGKITRSVSCHQSLYPFLVYYCHSLPKVRAYEVEILDVKTKEKINKGTAICHVDTSAWSPGHLAFAALGSSPGKIEVCHWIFEATMTWATADN